MHTHDSALYSCGKARALLSPPCMMNQAITYRGIGLPRLDVSAGSESSAQRMDAVTEDEEYRHFYLQYFFPPSSVGEVSIHSAPVVAPGTAFELRVLSVWTLGARGAGLQNMSAPFSCCMKHFCHPSFASLAGAS